MIDTMEADLNALLAELYQRGQEHDARLRNLEPDTAALISVLVRSFKRKRLLEIGTSNGYSTIWLAWAANRIGGRLTSIELDASRQGEAAENLRRADLRELVDLRLGDATEVVGELSRPFDLVTPRGGHEAGHRGGGRPGVSLAAVSVTVEEGPFATARRTTPA